MSYTTWIEKPPLYFGASILRKYSGDIPTRSASSSELNPAAFRYFFMLRDATS